MLTYVPAREDDLLPIFQLNKDLIDRYEDCESIDYAYVLNWVKENTRNQLPNFRRVLWEGETAGYFCLSPQENA